jgi:Spy/CpxP family protein refolding chaperone
MLKKRMLGVALVVGLGVSLAPLHAQRGPGPWRGPGPNMGRSLDLALDHQEELGLSRDQVSRLDELRIVLEGDVLPLAETMRALREAIWAGEIDRPEGFRQMEALRGELITVSAPLMGRIQEILTVEQHRKLQAIVWEARPGFGGAGMTPMARPRPGAGAALRGGWGGARFQPGVRSPMRWWRGGDPSGS